MAVPERVRMQMLADLAVTEASSQALGELAILRANLFIEEGLMLERVLEALHISRAGYYRRLKAARRGDGMLSVERALELRRLAQ